MERMLRAGAAAAAGLALLAATPADAGVFSVSPVRMFMTPRERAMAITIVNEGDAPLVLQTELNTWSQSPDGRDQLVATDDLVISPPILNIPAKSQQVVRLALLRAADPARQLTYRMILREVPEAVAPATPSVSVPVALAMNLPIFVSPAGAKRIVDCSVARAANGLAAVCGNSGTAYAQVREASLRRGTGELARFQGGNYVLPGVTKAIPLAGAGGPPVSGRAELHVSYDDGQTQVFEVTVP